MTYFHGTSIISSARHRTDIYVNRYYDLRLISNATVVDRWTNFFYLKLNFSTLLCRVGPSAFGSFTFYSDRAIPSDFTRAFAAITVSARFSRHLKSSGRCTLGLGIVQFWCFQDLLDHVRSPFTGQRSAVSSPSIFNTSHYHFYRITVVFAHYTADPYRLTDDNVV